MPYFCLKYIGTIILRLAARKSLLLSNIPVYLGCLTRSVEAAVPMIWIYKNVQFRTEVVPVEYKFQLHDCHYS
jgi:hypothetical protein